MGSSENVEWSAADNNRNALSMIWIFLSLFSHHASYLSLSLRCVYVLCMRCVYALCPLSLCCVYRQRAFSWYRVGRENFQALFNSCEILREAAGNVKLFLARYLRVTRRLLISNIRFRGKFLRESSVIYMRNGQQKFWFQICFAEFDIRCSALSEVTKGI